MMRKVVIMSGVSGSGKSTVVADTILEYMNGRFPGVGGLTPLTLNQILAVLPKGDPRATVSYCSADSFFLDMEGRYHFMPERLSDAHGKCFRDFITAIQAKCELVVVDNTNTTVEEISPYILGAQAFGYEAEVVVMTPPHNFMDHDTYIRRCAERNAHGVPEGGVRAQFNRILNRNLPPWWKVRYTESQF